MMSIFCNAAKKSLTWASNVTRGGTMSLVTKNFSSLNLPTTSIMNQRLLVPSTAENLSSRSVTKFSLQSGKRKTVKAVANRFKRLDWGIWIRTICGRHKKLYRKSANRKRRLRQHVFVNGTQSWLLDKMVTAYWRRPRHYVDDPYAPYHLREEFPYTRRSPRIPD